MAKPTQAEIAAAETAMAEQNSVPSLADLVNQARKASEYARNIQAEVDAARQVARDSFDAIYDELARLKAEHKDMDAFRQSKLGKLLENIR